MRSVWQLRNCAIARAAIDSGEVAFADATRAVFPLTRALAGRWMVLSRCPRHITHGRAITKASNDRTASMASTVASSPQSFAHVLLRYCAIAKLISSGSSYFVIIDRLKSIFEKERNFLGRVPFSESHPLFFSSPLHIPVALTRQPPSLAHVLQEPILWSNFRRALPRRWRCARSARRTGRRRTA